MPYQRASLSPHLLQLQLNVYARGKIQVDVPDSWANITLVEGLDGIADFSFGLVQPWTL